MEKTSQLSLLFFASFALLSMSNAAHAQSMSASISTGGSSDTPKAGENISIYRARSQTYLTAVSADKALGINATFLPRTTYVFDFSEAAQDKREKYKKYQTAERLLLPTMGFFVEALRRDSSGTQGSTLGVGLSFRSIQTLREGGNGQRAALAAYAGTAFGFWRTESEGRRASRLGSRVFAGLETRNGYVLEASYSDRPSVQGFSPRGASLSLGVRF
ncbi:hypothetical protein [Armatimonas sp.]|uniref:hypothetical protein n=1 Tax=Armatimonas sp. TaxID=1872638 RepID=UPI00286AAD97|nr:hypothetical protein [Armatimonas sp.]